MLDRVKSLDYEKRIEICKLCPAVRNSKGIGLTCGIFLLKNYIPETCGCKLSWKAKLKDQSCPQKKW
tara:strand:- start:2509 stop:2709 length:201 start_codon:yes stop_codon:yes gene_type:complete